MHQTSPALSAEATTRDAIHPSFRQAALIGHIDAFAQMQGDLDAVVYEACRVAAEGMSAGFAGVLLRIPTKSAGDSDPNQPPVPSEASRAFR